MHRARPFVFIYLAAMTAGCALGASPAAPPQASASRIVEARCPGAGIRVLHIQCGPGFLRVIGTAGADISAEGKIYTQAANLQEADRLCGEAQLRLNLKEPTEPSLEVSGPRVGTTSQSYRIDVTVKVPPGVRVVLRDDGGDLTVQGLKAGLDAQHQGGTLTISEVDGGLQVAHRGGASEISGVGGKITIDDGPGDLVVANASGNIEVRGGGGALVIRNVDGSVTARDNAQGMAISGVAGELNLYDIEPSALNLEACPGSIHFLKSVSK